MLYEMQSSRLPSNVSADSFAKSVGELSFTLPHATPIPLAENTDYKHSIASSSFEIHFIK